MPSVMDRGRERRKSATAENLLAWAGGRESRLFPRVFILSKKYDAADFGHDERRHRRQGDEEEGRRTRSRAGDDDSPGGDGQANMETEACEEGRDARRHVAAKEGDKCGGRVDRGAGRVGRTWRK